VSYEVLARKWRPQTFDEVVGQDHISRTLKRAVELGRLSHAYLFSGPRGCGKTSTARILAKVINCSNLQGGNPCNRCDSCVAVTQGRNLDVMEIDGASHTGVNEVRDLQESIGYVPSQFQNKVYIIDEVHMLSTHAFNALLKTLEEPPAHVYFIFATTAPHKIPDTIKSRCQRHQFKRLEVRDIADHLEKICVEEKVKFEKDALRLLARKAEGSMRDGQSLLDQCITASSADVRTQAVREILGLLDQELVIGFLRMIARGDASAVLKALDGAVHEGVDLEELLNGLIEGFRDLMLLSIPGDLSEFVFRSADDIVVMREALDELEVGDLVTIVERLCNLSPRLRTAGDPRILLESVLVDIALLDRQVALRELIEKLDDPSRSGGERAGGSRPARSPGRPQAASKRPPDTPAPPGPEDEAESIGPEPADEESFVSANSEPEDPGELDSKPGPDRQETLALAPQSAPPAAEVLAAKDVDIATLDYASQRRLWEAFVTHVRQKKVTLGVCLISGTLQDIDGNVVTLRFPKGCTFQRDQVDESSNRRFLEGMTKKFFGKAMDVVCIGSGEGRDSRKKPKDKVAPVAEPPAEGKEVEGHPLVKKILDDFDGEIIRFHPQ
jgi:DNA polymerase-3 subunit gamma/tau